MWVFELWVIRGSTVDASSLCRVNAKRHRSVSCEGCRIVVLGQSENQQTDYPKIVSHYLKTACLTRKRICLTSSTSVTSRTSQTSLLTVLVSPAGTRSQHISSPPRSRKPHPSSLCLPRRRIMRAKKSVVRAFSWKQANLSRFKPSLGQTILARSRGCF